jgi:predicted peptidase
MRRGQRFADLPVRIEQREITVDGRSQTYGLLIPKASPEDAGYPMVVGLHYASPTPGLSPYFGLGYVGQIVLPALQELNAILVAPDCPDSTWTSTVSERLVTAVIAAVQKENKVDARRTLVIGFSMGGIGAWYFAERHPELFRGAIPIAARPPEADAKPAIPIYVIHSRKDASQPFEATERAVQGMQQRGVNVTLVALDDVAHSELTGYIEPLSGAIPWIRKLWG